MTNRKLEAMAGIVIAIAGLATLVFLIPTYVATGFGFGLSPRVFPYVCAAAITALGLLLLLTRVVGEGGSGAISPVTVPMMRVFALIVGALALSIAVLSVFGYFAGGIVMVASFMILMGERSLLKVFSVSAIWTSALWILFEKMLGTPLP